MGILQICSHFALTLGPALETHFFQNLAQTAHLTLREDSWKVHALQCRCVLLNHGLAVHLGFLLQVTINLEANALADGHRLVTLLLPLAASMM